MTERLKAFKLIEKSMLGIIALLTILATAQEIKTIFDNRAIGLADLLLPVSYTHLTLPTKRIV